MSVIQLGIGPLAGVRELGALRRDELHAMGEEAADLARVADLGVPLGPIWVVGLSDDAERRVLAVVTAALALDRAAGTVVEIGSFFTTHALAARCKRLWPPTFALRRGDDVRARVRETFRALQAPGMLVAFGGARTEVGVRVTLRDEGPPVGAASLDLLSGDPDCVAVWTDPRQPWLLDRTTMRVVREGAGDLGSDAIARAADLADRAQLAIGRPVELGLGHLGGQLVVLSLAPIAVAPAFTDVSFRRVALLSADEGPVAPLAVDALDRALRQGAVRAGSREDDRPQVVRVYARAYRRTEAVATTDAGPPGGLGRVAARAAQVASDLSRPFGTVGALEQRTAARLAIFDREDLAALDRSALLTSLRERQRTVIDALALLESARVATAAAISTLEAACGTLPRECVHALAAIRRTRARRRHEEKLLRLARHIVDRLGEVPEPHRVPPALRRQWHDVRAELASVRPLGVDVRPRPYGADDATLHAALLDVLRRDLDAEEHARADAVRRLLQTARARPLGGARQGLVRTIVIGLSRLADVKGRIGDVLADAMLRLRVGACAVGGRLVDDGLLEQPDDALYLERIEIEEALRGEPGAYAARVRLRREADARWRHFDPPRRLAARTES